jgi:hypothetical protein
MQNIGWKNIKEREQMGGLGIEEKVILNNNKLVAKMCTCFRMGSSS